MITFGIPNFFGNPAHHGYVDVFTWRWTPALRFADGQYITWDIKNYVEGGAYLGLLPVLLAVIAVLGWLRPVERLRARLRHLPLGEFAGPSGARVTLPFFTVLALFSLGCIFGTPLYALVYALPLLKQSHSPFRWVFPLTLAVAILAGFGVEAVRRARTAIVEEPRRQGAPVRRHFLAACGRVLLLGAPPTTTATPSRRCGRRTAQTRSPTGNG